MKIEYNKEEKSITINDDYKKGLFLNKALLWISVFSLGMNSYNFYKKEDDKVIYIFSVIVLIAIIYTLFHLYLKMDTSKIIYLNNIQIFKKKNIFTNLSYSLKLKNGKYRRLPFLKDIKDVEELELFIQENQ